jgi:hypothetical protein
MRLETREGPKRVCWNSWIAPHNFEGFFLNFGDMLVKAGDPTRAVTMYSNAMLSHEYASWPFKDVLERRIADAPRNVEVFRREGGQRARRRSWFARPTHAWAAISGDVGGLDRIREDGPRRMKSSLSLSPVALLLTACAAVGTAALPGRPPHHVENGVRNLDPGTPRRPAGGTRARFWLSRMWASTIAARAFEVPRVAANGAMLADGTVPRVTWIGHSTLLVQLDGVNVLTNPQWSERAGPLPWLGPKRLSPPGVALAALPPIHIVVVSHDHYDHLDRATVKRLAGAHDPLFLVPLGLKRWFEHQGMSKVRELDWWESYGHAGVSFVCLPAHHRSQRAPWDADRRLRAS